MKINSQLERAQLENLSSLPTAATAGRVAWNTTDGKTYLDDASNWRALLRNDAKAILGNSGTAANNVRFHRGANGLLQLVSGADVTAEGTLSTALNQLSARMENYVDASKPAAASAGRLAYITDTGLLNVDTGSAWKVLVDSSTAQTLTNKSLTDPVLTASSLFTQIATPAAPSAGVTKFYSKANGKLYYMGSAGIEQEVGSGSGGAKNYLGGTANGSFETNSTTGWSLQSASLTGVIPSGTPSAGAASITTFATSATSPLASLYSLRLASSGVWAAGAALMSDAFTVDAEDSGKPLSFSFSYRVNSGLANANFSGTSATTFAVYVYDVTNSKWIQPSGVYSLIQGIGPGKAVGAFQADSNATQFKLALIAVNASAGAVDLTVDSFSVGPTVGTAAAPIVTNWSSYTPTITNITQSGSTAKYRRVGDSLQARVRVNITGTSAGVITIALPTGLSVDTAKLANSGSSRNLGTAGAYISASGTANNEGVVVFASATTVSIMSNYTSFWGASTPAAFSSGDFIEIDLTLPIEGWSALDGSSGGLSSVNSTVAAKYRTSGPRTAAVAQSINFDTKVQDTSGAVTTVVGDTAGWKFTAPESGFYAVELVLYTATGSASATYYTYVNGVQDTALGSGVVSGSFAGGATISYLKAGDYIDIRSDATPTTANAPALNTISIHKLNSAPSVATAAPVVARYETAVGQSIPGGGVSTTIDFGTKTYDSHGAVTTGASWKFTAPVSGWYCVKAVASFGTASFSSASAQYINIYKNGVDYALLSYEKNDATNASGFKNVRGSDDIQLNAGDYIDLRVAQQEGSARTLFTNATYNHVAISKIG